MAGLGGAFVVSASDDGVVKVWAPSGACISTVQAHSDIIWGIAVPKVANPLQFLTASADRSVKRWELQEQEHRSTGL